MAAKYSIYGEQVEELKGAISNGEMVELDIRNNDDKSWMRARVLISHSPMAAGESVSIIGLYGEVSREEWFLKIIEEVPELPED